VSLGRAFDTLEKPDADDEQTGSKHDAQQRVGDHDRPDTPHQRGKRLDLSEQHGNASSGTALNVPLLS